GGVLGDPALIQAETSLDVRAPLLGALSLLAAQHAGRIGRSVEEHRERRHRDDHDDDEGCHQPPHDVAKHPYRLIGSAVVVRRPASGRRTTTRVELLEYRRTTTGPRGPSSTACRSWSRRPCSGPPSPGPWPHRCSRSASRGSTSRASASRVPPTPWAGPRDPSC